MFCFVKIEVGEVEISLHLEISDEAYLLLHAVLDGMKEIASYSCQVVEKDAERRYKLITTRYLEEIMKLDATDYTFESSSMKVIEFLAM